MADHAAASGFLGRRRRGDAARLTFCGSYVGADKAFVAVLHPDLVLTVAHGASTPNSKLVCLRPNIQRLEPLCCLDKKEHFVRFAGVD